ncbi:MYCBP-associated protein family-domain-containing protein [Obelidium mucronatum]|nr:MYCBP-associated protein family-domain-containing protein [Obelidium mucronatum]
MSTQRPSLAVYSQLPPLPSAADITPHTYGEQETGAGTKRVLMVAKKMPPDYLGEELEYTQPSKRPIPLSLVTAKTKGPKKQKDGKLIEYTLLGDAEDFEAMEEELGEKTPDKSIDQPKALLEQQQIQAMEAQKEEQARAERLRLAHEKQIIERKRWLNRLYIFQKYREVREEHALRNWKRHSIQWNRVQRAVSKKSNKSRADLLMSRLGEHRERIEERDLIFEAFQLLEDRKVNFWSKGLRIGNDLLGLIVTPPKGGVRRIERLVTNEERHYKVPSNQNSYRELRKQELNHVIAKLDPFFKDGVGGYLEVVGKPLDYRQMEQLTEEYVEKLDNRAKRTLANQEVVIHDRPSPEKGVQDSRQPTQPTSMQKVGFKVNADAISNIPPLPSDMTADLIFVATHMTFEVLLNEVSRSVLSVYNQSTTAYHFEWRQVKKDNPLNVKAMHDHVQRFYFYHKRGVILPGTAFDFPIIFKSGSPGIFSETWELVTNPGVAPDVMTTITLQGFALEDDANKSKRGKIEALLDRRRATTAATEVLDGILEKLKPRNAPPNTLEKHKLLLTNDEQLFTVLNADLHLGYFPKLFERFEALANETLAILGCPPSLWDRSVHTIYANVSNIESIERRSQQLHKLNELVKLSTATISKSSFSPLYVVGYDTFVELADRMSECSESLRKRLGLPLVRPAAQFERPEEEEDQNVDRKPTPPVAEAKKGAAPAKDAKGKAAPPAGKGAPAAKGGKKGEAPPAEDASSRPQLAKITRKQPKPDSSRAWTRERRLLEAQYKTQFKTEVSQFVHVAIDRMFNLFEDISTYTVESLHGSESEVQAAIEVAKGVSVQLVAAKAVADVIEAQLATQKEENARKAAEMQEKTRKVVPIVSVAAVEEKEKAKVAPAPAAKRKTMSPGKERK